MGATANPNTADSELISHAGSNTHLTDIEAQAFGLSRAEAEVAARKMADSDARTDGGKYDAEMYFERAETETSIAERPQHFPPQNQPHGIVQQNSEDSDAGAVAINNEHPS